MLKKNLKGYRTFNNFFFELKEIMNQEFDFLSFKKKFSCFSFEEPEEKEWEPFSLGSYYVENHRQESDDWRLRIFRISDKKNQEVFSKYLSQVMDFAELEKYSFKTNFLSHIIGYSSNQQKNFKDFYIVQKNQKEKHLLQSQIGQMLEIECLALIRSIVTLYSHLFSEKDLIDNVWRLGVYVIDINEMFYYRKFRDELKSKKLPRYKLKFDFFNFVYKKLDKTIEKLHFGDLESFINQFVFKKVGMSFKIFKNRLENFDNLNWELIFNNPLFLQSIEGKIDWAFWKTNEFEKKKLTSDQDLKTARHKKSPFNVGNIFEKTLIPKKKNEKVKQLNKSPELKRSDFPKPLMKKKTVDLERKKGLLNRIKRFLKNGDFQIKKSDYIKIEEEEFLEGWIHDNLEVLQSPKRVESHHVVGVKKKYLANQKKFNIMTILKKLPETQPPLISTDDYDLFK